MTVHRLSPSKHENSAAVEDAPIAPQRPGINRYNNLVQVCIMKLHDSTSITQETMKYE
jgi:hypothetical protein